MKNRFITGTCLSLALAAILAVPALADEATAIHLIAYYSDSLTEQSGDNFEITVCREGDDASKSQVLQFDASGVGDSGDAKLPLESGSYQVMDITYNGYNKAIEKEGYAVSSYFAVPNSTEDYNTITLAIGTEEVEALYKQYEAVVIKQNGSYVSHSDMDDGIFSKSGTEENNSSTNPSETEGNESTKNPSTSEEKKSSESSNTEENTEKKTKVKYYDKKTKSSSVFARNVPILIAASICAIVLFVLHKKGKI